MIHSNVIGCVRVCVRVCAHSSPLRKFSQSSKAIAYGSHFWEAVALSLSVMAITAAPFLTKNSQRARSLHEAAQCSGVLWVKDLALGKHVR